MPWRITGTMHLKDGTDRREEIPLTSIFRLGVQDMTECINEELEELPPEQTAGVKIIITAEKQL